MRLQALFGFGCRGFDAGLHLHLQDESAQRRHQIPAVISPLRERRVGRGDRAAFGLRLADFDVPGLQLRKLPAKRLPFGGQEALVIGFGQLAKALGEALAQALRQVQGIQFPAQAGHDGAFWRIRKGGLQRFLQFPANAFSSGRGAFDALVRLATVRLPSGKDLVALLAELPPQFLIDVARRNAHRPPALLQALGFRHLFGGVAVAGGKRLRRRQDVPLQR